jgi:pimeloyl-ACP methyl ester carboxylesterase
MRQSIPALQTAAMSAEAVAEFLSAVPTATGATMGESIEADGLLSMAGSLLSVDAAVLDPVLNGTIDLLLDADLPFDPPTLIVTADPAKPDAVADPEVARHFASISPATEVVTIAGAGHLIHDEVASRPAFREAVMGFLARFDP